MIYKLYHKPITLNMTFSECFRLTLFGYSNSLRTEVFNINRKGYDTRRKYVMDYSKILQNLSEASLFDLFRIKVAIDRELNNPARIQEVRARIQIGQTVEYFDETQNKLIQAKVLELKRTRLLVENLHDRRRWNLAFFYINIDKRDATIRVNPKKGIDRNTLKVGDSVGFQDRNNNELVGKVTKLNQKTASLIVNHSERWKVHYSYLYPVIDVETGVIDTCLLLD